MQPLNKVLDQLEDYSQRGDEFRARCPAHNGESEDSLSVQENEDGKVLLHCHSGCGNEEIIEALDLEMSDLFSERQGQGQADRSAREGRRAGRGPYCRGATGHHK